MIFTIYQDKADVLHRYDCKTDSTSNQLLSAAEGDGARGEKRVRGRCSKEAGICSKGGWRCSKEGGEERKRVRGRCMGRGVARSQTYRRVKDALGMEHI